MKKITYILLCLMVGCSTTFEKEGNTNNHSEETIKKTYDSASIIDTTSNVYKEINSFFSYEKNGYKRDYDEILKNGINVYNSKHTYSTPFLKELIPRTKKELISFYRHFEEEKALKKTDTPITYANNLIGLYACRDSEDCLLIYMNLYYIADIDIVGEEYMMGIFDGIDFATSIANRNAFLEIYNNLNKDLKEVFSVFY